MWFFGLCCPRAGSESVRKMLSFMFSFVRLSGSYRACTTVQITWKKKMYVFFFLSKSIMISFILWLPTFLLLSFENIGVVLTTLSFHWRCLDQVVFVLSQKKRRKIFLLQGIDQLEMNFISDPSFRVDFTIDGKPKLKSFFGAAYGLKLSRQ